MLEKNSWAVGFFRNHQDAESAVKELQKSGYDMKTLSVVGKDYQTEQNVVGCYNSGDRMAAWGKYGLFWGWIWGVLFGSAFFVIPGLGPIMVGGSLIAWIVGALASIGIPEDSVIRYETAMQRQRSIVPWLRENPCSLNRQPREQQSPVRSVELGCV